MTITLAPAAAEKLRRIAHYCNLPEEKMAQLFVEDGIRSYNSSGELEELDRSIRGNSPATQP